MESVQSEQNQEVPSILLENMKALKENERRLSEIRPQLDVLTYLSKLQEALKEQPEMNIRFLENDLLRNEDSGLRFLYGTLSDTYLRALIGHGTENTAISRLLSTGIIIQSDIKFTKAYIPYIESYKSPSFHIVKTSPIISISVEDLHASPKHQSDPTPPGVYAGQIDFTLNHAKTIHELAKYRVLFNSTVQTIERLRKSLQSLGYDEIKINKILYPPKK